MSLTLYTRSLPEALHGKTGWGAEQRALLSGSEAKQSLCQSQGSWEAQTGIRSSQGSQEKKEIQRTEADGLLVEF